MEQTITNRIQVSPKIGRLNKYLQQVKQVAINSIDPVFVDNELQALSLCVEGPPRHMSYLARLLAADTDLKVS